MCLCKGVQTSPYSLLCVTFSFHSHSSTYKLWQVFSTIYLHVAGQHLEVNLQKRKSRDRDTSDIHLTVLAILKVRGKNEDSERLRKSSRSSSQPSWTTSKRRILKRQRWRLQVSRSRGPFPCGCHQWRTLLSFLTLTR